MFYAHAHTTQFFGAETTQGSTIFLKMKKTALSSLLPFLFSQFGLGSRPSRAGRLCSSCESGLSLPGRTQARSAYKRWLQGDTKSPPQPRLLSSAALTLLAAGAVVPSWAGAGSVHGVARAAVLAQAFLGASVPIETASTSYRRQAEIPSGSWLQKQQSHPTRGPTEQSLARGVLWEQKLSP